MREGSLTCNMFRWKNIHRWQKWNFVLKKKSVFWKFFVALPFIFKEGCQSSHRTNIFCVKVIKHMWISATGHQMVTSKLLVCLQRPLAWLLMVRDGLSRLSSMTYRHIVHMQWQKVSCGVNKHGYFRLYIFNIQSTALWVRSAWFYTCCSDKSLWCSERLDQNE